MPKPYHTPKGERLTLASDADMREALRESGERALQRVDDGAIEDALKFEGAGPMVQVPVYPDDVHDAAIQLQRMGYGAGAR